MWQEIGRRLQEIAGDCRRLDVCACGVGSLHKDLR